MYLDPKDLGFEYIEEMVSLPSGYQISTWVFKGQKAGACSQQHGRNLILHFHGNAQNISTHFTQLAWVAKQGVDYVIMDYPGYGKSSGKATRSSIHQASKEYLQYTFEKELQRSSPRKITLYAQSLGGAVLLGALTELIQEKPHLAKAVKLIVLESTFASYRSVANEKLAESWITWPLQWLAYLLVTDKHSGEESLNLTQGISKVVLHGDSDRIVPLVESKELFKQLPEPKELWVLPGLGHLQLLVSGTGVAEKIMHKICAQP